MNKSERQTVIRVLKVLLTLDDNEIIHCTIESLIEDLEDADLRNMNGSDCDDTLRK